MLHPFIGGRWALKAVSLIFAALSVFLCPTRTSAAPTVDTTWANAGRLTFNMNGGTQSVGQQVLPAPDGKLLVLGFCTSQAAADYCVRRLNANGSNDTTFGTGGQGEVAIDLGGQDFPSTMDIAPDGKIVIGGNGATGQLVRLTANGQRDTSFGTNGVLATSVYRIFALRVRGDGKIVYTGDCPVTPQRFCIARTNSNGTTDTTFNGGNLLHFTPAFTAAGKQANSRALTLAPDGSAFLGGSCDGSTTTTQRLQFCVAKISPTGAVDTTFGSAGTMNFGILGVTDSIDSLALQADGKLVAVGTCRDTSTLESHICAARYGNTGLDGNFGGGLGYVSITLGSLSIVYQPRIQMQNDGKLLISGFCYTAKQLCIVRLRDDGSPDQNFSGGGIFYLPLADPATIPPQTTSWAAGAVPIGSAGDKLMAFGHCGPQSNTSIYAPCLVRLNIAPPAASQCSLDIDGDGRVSATTDGLLLARIALGMTGNAVVAGGASNPNGERPTWPLVQDYLTRHCGMNLVP